MTGAVSFQAEEVDGADGSEAKTKAEQLLRALHRAAVHGELTAIRELLTVDDWRR